MSHVAPRPDRGPQRRPASALPASEDQAPEPSIGQLVADASRDVSKLIHNEIALAKSEVKVSVKAGGLGAALFAVAGVIFLLGVIMFSVALAYFLSMTGLHLAWCFLIVFLLYAAMAGALAFVGYLKIRTVRPPKRAIHQAQETKNTLMNRS
jgi:hypothetical protein